MPEITNAINIQSKLQEFDERMNGAIEAADMFIQFKEKAEELEEIWEQIQEIESNWHSLQEEITNSIDNSRSAVSNMDNHVEAIENKLNNKSDALLEQQHNIRSETDQHIQSELFTIEKNIEDKQYSFSVELKEQLSDLETGLSSHVQEIEKKWERLQGEISHSINNSHSAISDIDQHLETVENQLDAKNNTLLQQHQTLIYQSTALAEQIDKDKKECQELVEKITEEKEVFQNAIRSETNQYIQDKFSDIEEKQHVLFSDLQEKTTASEQNLYQQSANLEENLTTKLNNHQNETNNKIKDFLSQQNVLIQNLSQQIDGFERSSKTVLADQQIIKHDLKVLIKRIRIIDEKQAHQDQKNTEYNQNIQQLTDRLDKTIKQLQDTSFIGNKFNDI